MGGCSRRGAKVARGSGPRVHLDRSHRVPGRRTLAAGRTHHGEGVTAGADCAFNAGMECIGNMSELCRRVCALFLCHFNAGTLLLEKLNTKHVAV